MSISLISSSHRPEHLNLQVIWGLIILAMIVGAAATATLFLTSGSDLTGDVGVAAALAQAALLAGLSTAVAGTIGFLFGIPRLPAVKKGDTEPQGLSNATSLEDIADWVTKMLVGAALVSLAFLPDILAELRRFAAIGRGSDWAERIGLLVVFYFSVMGFLFGYTLSRMQFLTLLERAPFVKTAIRALQRMPITPGGLQRARLSVEELTAIETFSRTAPAQLRGRQERRQWAKAQLVASGGDLDEAERIYERLVGVDPDPQIQAELRALHERRQLLETPEAGATNSSTGQAAAPTSLSPRAAIDEMFGSLYLPPPQGFETVIRIGEDLVQRVQDAAVWAYLACAYGQKYRFFQARSESSLDSLSGIRERCLFCIKQALDLDAARWRPLLRSFWDRSAIRPDDDDDLVVFSGDPQFAALLDPDSLGTSAFPEGLAGGLGPTLLTPQRLVRYDGHAHLWLTHADGTRVPGAVPKLRPGAPYRLVMKLSPGNRPEAMLPGKIEALRIPEGEDRPLVEFEFRPDAIDTRFAPDRNCVTASLDAPTAESDFKFAAPERPGEQQLFVEIAQNRRIVKTISLKIDVVDADG